MHSLRADDLQISTQGKDIRFIEWQSPTSINHIVKWCILNGFKISGEKTPSVHFCRKRGLHLDPELFIESSKIDIYDCAKLLGFSLTN